MFKKVIRFLILVISISAIVFCGNYIYQKQSVGINFESYAISKTNSTFYIPNAENFIEKQLDTLKGFNLPHDILKSHTHLNRLTRYNFNDLISKEIYISYENNDFAIIFKNFSLKIETVIEALTKQLQISAVISNNKINFNDKSYFYKKIGAFFIFSSVAIKPGIKHESTISKGNFDYSFQKSNELPINYFIQDGNKTISFKSILSDTIKGAPIDPKTYFKITPTDFDQITFIGSTRIQTDVDKLLKTSNPTKFYTWCNNGIVHVKKDSFELIIGQQNDFELLKNKLDEQTLKLSKDSLLPTPFFKNSFEISFFNSTLDWASILPETNSAFSVYTELNNFNILANSVESINWYIKQIQLGTVFSDQIDSFELPQKMHTLKVNKIDDKLNIELQNWINKTTCFETNIKSASSVSDPEGAILVSNFLSLHHRSNLTYIPGPDTSLILVSNDESIICYTTLGKVKWTKPLKSTLLKKPIPIENELFLLATRNGVDLLDLNGQSQPGFPLTIPDIKDVDIAITSDNSAKKIVIISKNNLLNYNLSGKAIESWKQPTFNAPIKSKIHTQSISKKDYIFISDIKDSLYILNRKGELTLKTHFDLTISKNSQNLSKGNDTKDIKLLSFENGHIKNRFPSKKISDSIKIQHNTTIISVNWVYKNKKNLLLIEEYNRLLFFNEYGFLEQEIQKPQPNLTYIPSPDFNSNYFVFGNLTKNELYLLDSFGQRVNAKPLNGGLNHCIVDDQILVYFDSQIWIYDL